MGFSYDRAAKKEADAKRADEKPFTGKGRYGTAPPLTSHGGRSRVAKREGGKTLRDAVTAGCHAVLKRFIGDSEYLNKEEEIPRLVRAEESKVGADVPDDVIMKRFRNIIACSSKLPSGAAARWEQMKADRPMHMMNKKERRHAKRKAAALAAEVAAAKK